MIAAWPLGLRGWQEWWDKQDKPPRFQSLLSPLGIHDGMTLHSQARLEFSQYLQK